MTGLRIVAMCMLVVATGCEKRSAFCNDNPDVAGCGEGSGTDSAGSGCDSCADPKPFCANDTCVQCLLSTDCMGTSPVCDQNVCTACTSHADCAAATAASDKKSDACLPTGACGTDDDVAYVDPVAGMDAGNMTCNLATPCKTIMAALGAKKLFIKLTGVMTDTFATDKAFTFLADPGTRLTSPTGDIVTVMGGAGANIKIYDLAIGGVSGSNVLGACVRMTSMDGHLELHNSELAFCNGGGLEATGGNIVIAQSTIHENQAGGINMVMNVATFDITNTYLFRNGDTSSASVGGAALIASDAMHSRFDFNTIVDNNIKSLSTSAGVNCDLANFHAKNNILAHNAVNGDPNAAAANKFGQCMHDTTAIATTVDSFMFKQATTSPYNYGLASMSSAAVDQGTTVSTIDIDFNGTTRPKMSNKDQGAFEFDPAHP